MTKAIHQLFSPSLEALGHKITEIHRGQGGRKTLQETLGTSKYGSILLPSHSQLLRERLWTRSLVDGVLMGHVGCHVEHCEGCLMQSPAVIYNITRSFARAGLEGATRSDNHRTRRRSK